MAAEYYRRLRDAYPDAHCALDHRNAYELLVATILSAQCTDVRVNMVTPALFAKYPDAAALAAADRGELEQLIKSTGFFRNKAKSLERDGARRDGAARRRDPAHHGGARRSSPASAARPRTSILGNAFGMNAGVVVDTHVARLSHLMGLTRETDPVKIEQDLIAQFPNAEWTMLSHLLIEHGRRICIARRPKCGECVLADLCPSAAL